MKNKKPIENENIMENTGLMPVLFSKTEVNITYIIENAIIVGDDEDEN